jgi:hypothetical protein
MFPGPEINFRDCRAGSDRPLGGASRRGYAGSKIPRSSQSSTRSPQTVVAWAASQTRTSRSTTAKVRRWAAGSPASTQFELGQPRLGRPLRAAERVLAELPRQVLVVGAQPAGQREDHVEQPGQRLGCVQPGLEQAPVAGVLQRAVDEVHVAVQPVLVDQHPPLLVVVDGRLASYGVADAAARTVAQHLRMSEGPAEVPVAGAVRVDLLEVGEGEWDLVDRRAAALPPPHAVVAHDVHVDVRAAGGHVKPRRGAAQDQPEDRRVLPLDQLVESGPGVVVQHDSDRTERPASAASGFSSARSRPRTRRSRRRWWPSRARPGR